MLEEQIDNLVVQIEYEGIKGSGVLYQPDTKAYSYLITAAHCLYGDKLYDKEIAFSNIRVHRQKNGKMEEVSVTVLQVLPVLERDLVLLKLNYLEGIEPYVIETRKINTRVTMFGFPKAFEEIECPYKRYKLNGCVNEWPQSGVMQINTESPIETNETGAIDVISGMSGSGIFVIKEHAFWLLGILNRLSSRDGAFAGMLGNSVLFLQEKLTEWKLCGLKQVSRPKVKPSENRLLSISHTISDEIISSIKAEECSMTYRECGEWMERKGISYIQILGEGGTGKTSFLLRIAEYLEEQDGKTAIYIRLNDLNDLRPDEKETFLETEIRRQNTDNLLEDESVFLLLDGFNEVKNEEKLGLSNQIKKLLVTEKVKIILASRRKIDSTVGIYGISTFTMERLTDEQIESYLKQQNIDKRQAEPFWELLGNPMMLTVYAKTCEEFNHHQNIDYFRFYENYHTKAELMSNYLESLAAKRFVQVIGGTERQKELTQVLYVIHFVLPYLAYKMEKRNEFAVGLDKVYEEIEHLLISEHANSSYLKNWFGKRGISDVQYLNRMETVEIIEYLKNFPTVFYQEKSWHFTHHHFRDELSAQFLISESEKGVWKNEIPQVFHHVWREEIIEFVGELLGMHRKDYAGRMGDVLHHILNLLRGKSAEEIRIPLHNILQVWKNANGNLAGEDFSGLDLKGQILEPYLNGNGGIFKTDFTDAIVYPENLLSIGHKGVVCQVCYSSDGRLLATLGDDGDVCLWDASVGQLIRRMKMERQSFGSGLEFSEDCQLLAVASFENVIVWEVESGEQKYYFEGHNGYIISHIAFHPSGMELASGGQDGRICVWDIKTGTQCLCLENRDQEYLEYHGSNEVSFCYSPDGTYLAAGFGNGSMQVWEAQTGREVFNIKAHQCEILDIKYSPDCKYLGTASRDMTAAIWDTETGSRIAELKEQTRDIFELNFSPDSSKVATVSMDNSACIYDAKTGKCLHRLTGHHDFVKHVRFHPGGEYLATASCDGNVIIWEVDTGKMRHILKEHRDIVSAISFNLDGRYLATASVDENVYIWNTSSGKILYPLKNNGKRIDNFWMASETIFLTMDYTEYVARVWDVCSGKYLWKKENTGYKSNFHPKGTQFLDWVEYNRFDVWDIRRSTLLWKKSAEVGIQDLLYSPDGEHVICVLKDGTTEIFVSKDGSERAVLSEKISHVTFRSDGTYLAGETKNAIFIWECEGWELVATYQKSREMFLSPQFVYNDHFLAVDEWNRGIYFLDLESDRVVRAESREKEKILSKKEDFFVTVSEQNELKTWNYETGKVKQSIKLPSGEITKLTCHLQCGLAAVLFRNGEIVIVHIPSEQILAQISAIDENIWNQKFSQDGARLFVMSGPILYGLEWKTKQWEIVIDQRYEERLKGCNLQNAQFDEALTLTDIALLKRY